MMGPEFPKMCIITTCSMKDKFMGNSPLNVLQGVQVLFSVIV
uniref:Uncharacterized protein n=1 Tax=Rhizophora mucronata TaxID=61149 RepID=A0A2P2PJB8_RHIMU